MTPSLRDLLLASLKVGCLGFGGPAGQIALMHRVFVEEKRWIDEPRYLHALGFCTLLPGPEAQQLATYVGWSLRGTWGGLAAGLLFVLPGAALMFALSWLYAVHGETPLVAAAFDGVKAAVLALVLEAIVRLGRRALTGPADAIIAVAAFVALTVAGLPFPLVVLAAAAIGAIRGRPDVEEPAEAAPLPPKRRTLATILLWTVIWLAPLAASLVLLGGDHWLSRLGGVFAALAATSFGGAYALLAWLQQQAVETYGWLTTAQMVDGLGLAETTPGPLVLVNPFVGFMAGWNATGGGLGWAAAGSSMALWQTFAPSFLFIFAGAPYADALRRSRLARGALAGVMAAVLGVVAGLALWFGRQVLLPEGQGFDAGAAAVAVIAAIALMRFRANVVLVVAACAAAGVVRALLA
ncbi:chromate efflux transporter [Caulobacter mirabilis]|uniref:chromate efflux transporter n=1 Tax=Caulobacter mirabilis TaxID=69666 RepID=UPI001FE8ED2E|nr:chromate efflux transporter [Caulobacter mirabilis]